MIEVAYEPPQVSKHVTMPEDICHNNTSVSSELNHSSHQLVKDFNERLLRFASILIFHL